MEVQVAIVGGGIAGLAAARALVEQGIEVELLEAADRLGGRARTLHHDDSARGTARDSLGARSLSGGTRVAA